MTFAIFRDARMIYSHMKSNAEGLGSEGTGRWRAVVAAEGLNVTGVACGTHRRRKHRRRAWGKGWGERGCRGVQKSSRRWRDCEVLRDWRNFGGRKRHHIKQDGNGVTGRCIQ